jgi:hypothetical protein
MFGESRGHREHPAFNLHEPSAVVDIIQRGQVVGSAPIAPAECERQVAENSVYFSVIPG